MSRLQAEAARLYLPLAEQPEGHTRAMVLSLGRPAEWAPLAAVWQAVQSELGLPAPAIAVSGTDSYQLWFSLAEPVPMGQAETFLAALCQQHLSAIAPSRIACWPAATTPPAQPNAEGAIDLPGRSPAPDQWSAFVAPDLAPMFAETPWLDLPPSPEGQAELLSRQQSITADAWRTATARMMLASVTATTEMGALPAPAGPSSAQRYDDPRHFLNDVMNDLHTPLALRIEAAKALLAHVPAQP